MEQLPLVDLDAVAPGTVLILAPHPDDESLGCGGLIATACARLRPPLVVVVTDGTGSHPGSRDWPPDRLRALRETEVLAAVGILGLPPSRVQFLRLPDTRTPQHGPAFDRAAEQVASMVRDCGVETICTTWRHDPHCDHAAAHVLGAAVAAGTGTQLLNYPIWGWMLPAGHDLDEGAVAGVRLDIAAQLRRKRRAIAAHASQGSDLIADAPDGFRLPGELIAIFERPYEVFLRTGMA
jgi:LmbE family N-acetylglucosaminyl deacetylase